MPELTVHEDLSCFCTPLAGTSSRSFEMNGISLVRVSAKFVSPGVHLSGFNEDWLCLSLVESTRILFLAPSRSLKV